MELTRRGWATVGCAGVLVVGALLLASPILLAGAAAIGAWLLGAQWSFLRRLTAHRETASVSLETDRPRPLVGDETTVTMTVHDGEGTMLPTRVSLALPAAANAGDEDELAIAVNDGAAVVADDTIATRDTMATRDTTAADGTAETVSEPGVTIGTVGWPVAGAYEFDAPTVAVADPFGLFREAYAADASLTVSVRPRRPETVHLGKGGERVAAAFGEHTAGQTGPGIEPAELREYQPGDDVSRIDWKATARLVTPHVTEAEAETDRRTVLLLDRRATMAIGRDGVTPLAYLRHAALAIVESASDLGDPLGLSVVGDDGVTAAEPPRTMAGQYRSIAATIRELGPTDGPADPPTTRSATTAAGASRTTTPPEHGATATASPAPTATGTGADRARASARSDGGAVTSGTDAAYATRAGARLAGDDSQFARRLQPLLEDATPYLHRVESDPLFSAARTYLGRLQGTVWTVLITDDTRRGELRETVRLARRGNDHVLVILAPRTLFAADGLADLDAAYRQYSEFDEFRRELASMDRVEALELAPGDRVETIIERQGGRQS